MIVLPNMVFGDLITIKFAHSIGGHYMWLCKCLCGTEKKIRESCLISGNSTKCGECNYEIKFPLAYNSWRSLIQRCENKNSSDYKNYGGRGIKVCQRWARFIYFLEDMGEPPTDKITGQRFTLERQDVNGNYEKDNCIWASPLTQNNNRRNNLSPGSRLAKYKYDHRKYYISK